MKGILYKLGVSRISGAIIDNTPLHEAVWTGSLAAVQQAFSKNAGQINHINSMSHTALDDARERRRKGETGEFDQIIKFLEKKGGKTYKEIITHLGPDANTRTEINQQILAGALLPTVETQQPTFVHLPFLRIGLAGIALAVTAGFVFSDYIRERTFVLIPVAMLGALVSWAYSDYQKNERSFLRDYSTIARGVQGVFFTSLIFCIALITVCCLPKEKQEQLTSVGEVLFTFFKKVLDAFSQETEKNGTPYPQQTKNAPS